MKKTAYIIILLAISMTVIWATPGELIPYGDPLYDDMDSLFILNGQTIPSASRPWTKAEALNELTKIDPSSLTGYSLSLYEKILSCVSDNHEAVLSLDMGLSPEIYAHTNTDFDTEDYWIYNYNRRSMIGTISLDASVGGYNAHTELFFGVGRATGNDRMANFEQNLDSFPVDMTTKKYVVSSDIYSPYFRFNFPASGEADVTTPTIGWLIYAWKNGSIGVYRTKKEWGKTSIGNYIYDSHVSAYNYVSAKFFNRIFSFDYTVMFPSSYFGGIAKGYEIEYQCLFLSHRLQIQLLKNLSIAMSENVMYWLKDGLEPIFLNPAVFYHNNVQGYLFNALAHVELEYVPFKGLRLYSQLGVDQGSVPFFERGEEDVAMGFTIGSEYLFALSGGVMAVNLEGAIVTPAMYRRGGQYPDFIIADVATIDDISDYYTLPFVTAMGFPYGGDTLAAKAEVDYKKDSLHCSLSSLLKWKGEQTIIKPKTVITGFELTGDVVFDAAVSALVEYDFVMLKRLQTKLSTTLSGVYDHERGFDVQLSVGVSISVAAKLLEK